MALTKVITQDKIEVVGEYRAVQVRTKTAVMEDGVELSAGFHRHVVLLLRRQQIHRQNKNHKKILFDNIPL